ncbi:unnamed protein product [Linum tenue]|uniref:Uncharacterized protein n=5 Tax=Linum tenue TaxID=586396 RepID=A0AAV0IFI5_9ROSI|nr:unnamed protein product [Linum tenue]
MRGVGFPWWLLANNTNLEELSIHNCSLSGSFQLPPNQDFGRISEQLPNCSKLESQDASNNHLSGKIPSSIWNFPRLVLLDLSKNNFFGSLPSGFITSQMLAVYLSRNHLGGTLTKGDHEVSKLSVLDLSYNHLTGTIPIWISKLPSLSYLLLNNNKLHGEVLVPFCLEHLKLIVISHNHFHGHLSSAITTNGSCKEAPNVRIVSRDLEFVTKTHLYTYAGTSLSLMVGLDFSDNNFTGEIPPQISDIMGSIKGLNLSYNKLTGSIPPSFSKMLEIESLDLSHNNLSGFIPSQLTELTSLASFSVTYNNLSSKCPPRVAQFATFDEASYQGNPFLCCTFPLQPSKPLFTPLASDDQDDDDDDGGRGGFIDMESFYASSGVSFVMALLIIASVLYINLYWRRVWFYYVGVTITSCYYFVVDHLPVPVKYKVLKLQV